MYKRILVPLDGSELAEQVLPYARVFASGLDSPIELLQVCESIRAPSGETVQGAHPQILENSRLDQAQNYLGVITKLLEDLRVSVSAREGDPTSLIASCAGDGPNTLITMCTHGRAGIKRWVLGSITEKLLHVTASPMLIVRCYGIANADSAIQDGWKGGARYCL